MSSRSTLKILTLLIICFLLCACKSKDKHTEDFKFVLDKKVQLKMFKKVNRKDDSFCFNSFRKSYKFISLVYLKTGCNKCYIDFINWHKKMKNLTRNHNYTVLFIIEGQNYKDFYFKAFQIDSVELKYYAIMDKNLKFLKGNANLPQWALDSSILIDSENKIKMVGAPFATPEMTDLFYEICAK